MAKTLEVGRAHSSDPNPQRAVAELFQGLGDVSSSFVVLFCSAHFDLDVIASEIPRYIDPHQIVGCTTAGEITPEGSANRSLVAFALPQSHFAVETVVIQDLSEVSGSSIESRLMTALARLRNRALADVDSHTFAMSLLDGMSSCEERALESICSALGNIPLVGGSAGDNLSFTDTYVFYDGAFLDNSAAIILVNTACPFVVFSDHHLRPTDTKFVITDCSTSDRIVHELNAEAAADVVAEMCGCRIDELDSITFASHPMAVHIAGNYYIRSIQQVRDGDSLRYFCAIDNGVVLTQMESSDIVDHLHELFGGITAQVGPPLLTIAYDCIHRRLEMESKQLLDEVSPVYRRFNVLGFCSYGEHFREMHVNHTFTGIAIGSPL